jgi:hypothetical protein
MQTKKTIAITLILIQIIILQPISTYAFLGLPSNPLSGGGGSGTSGKIRSGINDFLEKDLNINVKDGLRPLTESINTIDRKGEMPEVSLRFSSQSPKEGEKITVSADVTGVKNPNDAYYVWYLKRKGDSYDDIDKLHRQAVSAQAALYYDPETLNQKFNQGIVASKGDDYDGYKPKMGGDNGILRGATSKSGSSLLQQHETATGNIKDAHQGIIDSLPGFGIFDVLAPGTSQIMDAQNQVRDSLLNSTGTKANDTKSASGNRDYCYIYNSKTGKQYELGDAHDDSAMGCPTGYIAKCMQENNDLMCPVAVPGMTGTSTASSSGGGNTSSSSTSTTIAGGNGDRFSYLTRCLDTEIKPTCDVNTGKLHCSQADKGNVFQADKAYSCDGTSCSSYKTDGHCCEVFDTIEKCKADKDTKICTMGSQMMAVSYSYDQPITTPTPYCVKQDQKTGEIWKDPNVTGCTSTKSIRSDESMPDPLVYYQSGAGCSPAEGAGDCPADCTATINGTTSSNCSAIANGDRPHFRFSSPGPSYCAPGSTCNVTVDCFGVSTDYSFTGPADAACPTNPGLPGRYDEGEFVWKGKSESDCKLAIIGKSQGLKSVTDVVKEPEKACTLSTPKDSGCTEKQHLFPEELNLGFFPASIEAQYGTNPIDAQTTPLAINDGALAVGLGVKNFEWKYKAGDEIAVVVEGMGLGMTKHEDATYQTVFAVPKEGCQKAIENASKESYEETAKKKVVTIEVAEMNPRDCVTAEIFQKPGTSQFDALNVNVNHASPSAQNTSVASGLSQPMQITAHANGVKGGGISNSEHLYYEWSIVCGGKTIDLSKMEGLSKTEGMNLPSLNLTANFPQECVDAGEVIVKTKINEPRAGGGSNFGQSETKIKIYDVKDSPLKTFKTEIVEDTKFQKTATAVCDVGIDKTLCRVMNNEVIAIAATKDDGTIYDGTMLSWTVDGKAYNCDSSISPDCNDRTNSGTIIIPMTGSDGDLVTVTASINDVTGDKNNTQVLSRVFRVTDSQISITPVSGAVVKELGSYEDLNGKKFTKQSTTTLQTIKGTSITLKAVLYPEFLNKGDEKYTWTIDGKDYANTNPITFVADKDVSVGVSSGFELSSAERWAHNQAFGSGLADTQKETLSKTIQIELSDSVKLTKLQNGFFATVAHNTPQYLLFILKMTLMMGIMLFIPSLILGFKR